MIRSPLLVTMPGNTVWPIRPERGGITTSARPELRLNSVSSAPIGAASSPERQMHPRRERGRGFGVAAQQQVIALGDQRPGAAARRFRRPARRRAAVRGSAARSTASAGARRASGELGRTRMLRTCRSARPYCSTSVRAWLAEVGRHGRRRCAPAAAVGRTAR